MTVPAHAGWQITCILVLDNGPVIGPHIIPESNTFDNFINWDDVCNCTLLCCALNCKNFNEFSFFIRRSSTLFGWDHLI